LEKTDCTLSFFIERNRTMRTKGLLEFKLLHGTHYEGGKKHTKGDSVFSAKDLEETFGSKRFQRISPEWDEKKEEEVASKFEIEHRGGGRYNVVNIETDEVLNDSLLSKEEAVALVGEGDGKED